MRIVGKIVSVLVMILSAVLLLAFLAGIAGVWWGQGQLKGVVTDLSTSVDRSLERTQTTVGMVNILVINTQGRVDQASANITNAGTKVEETNLVLAAAQRLLDQDLTPTVERVNDRVSGARDMLDVADKTISLMKFLPGAQDNKLLTVADGAIVKVKSLGQAVDDTRTSIQATKSAVTAEAVNKLTTPLGRVSTALGALSGDLVELGQRIDARQAQLADLTSRALTAITVAALILSLALLWMAMAQLGLFLHALGGFTGRDPLPGWHKGKKSEETAPVVPEVTGGVA